MGDCMRAMMAGLFGLCLALAVPAVGEARTEPRQGAQTAAARPAPSAGAAPASRQPAAARAAAPARTGADRAPRPSAAPSSSPPPRAAASRRPAPSALPYAARQPSADGLRRDASAACTVRNGRRICGPREAALRWTGGLAPAAMSQASCPEGTMATLAIGHSNVVRCVPL